MGGPNSRPEACKCGRISTGTPMMHWTSAMRSARLRRGPSSSLDDLSKILGLAGKPEGVAGSRVEEMVLAVGGSPSTREAAGPAEAAAGATERKLLRNIVHTCGWRGAPGACQLWTGRHR